MLIIKKVIIKYIINKYRLIIVKIYNKVDNKCVYKLKELYNKKQKE